MRPILLDFDESTVTIFWANQGSAYDVQWKKAQDADWTPLSLKSSLMKKKNIEAGTTYHFRVKSTDATTFDEPLEWTHPSASQQPSAPSVVMEIMPNDVQLLSATVQWTPNGSTSPPPYEVQFLAMDGVSDWVTATATASSTAIKKKNLPNQASPYAFRWRSASSTLWSRTAGPILPPAPATALSRAIAPTLVSNNGTSVSSASLGGKVIGLYFSAHWCPPCRQFTPMLAQFYNTMKQLGKPFEIVFVSADQSQDEFNGYFREMPWLAVRYDSNERKEIEARHRVESIPTLKILNAQGTIIDPDGRQRALQQATFDQWYARCYSS
ncbi:hypothetical protein LEN26_021111 [Aphanomyces euteiches]|nr:hypothetical protein LEN26_021111 [Aphanomyces euteiches]KAH9115435.1 hypothetical protein AeMF1_010528 [Aphanomyces euteiches]KAH9192949.1 hypothetical protein AeNC1_005069 [Aphanomyces euteiches]